MGLRGDVCLGARGVCLCTERGINTIRCRFLRSLRRTRPPVSSLEPEASFVVCAAVYRTPVHEILAHAMTPRTTPIP